MLRHLDVPEHHFESLREVETTLFLEFFDDFLLRVFENTPLVKQSLGEIIFVERLKYVLVLQVAENLNDLVDFVGNFNLSIVLEVLLELFIEIHDQTFGCLLILIDEVLKAIHNGQLDLAVPLQRLAVQLYHFVTEVDYLTHQIIV